MHNKKYRLKMVVSSEHSHGFITPYSPHQMFTWFAFMANILIEFIVHFPTCYDKFPKLLWFIIYVIFALMTDIAVIYYGYKTTKSDPSDLTVRNNRYCNLIQT